MDKIDHLARQDRAIDHPDADALERGPFVRSLVKTLVHAERNENGAVVSCRATGFVVGLTGEWGLGKSSVLNLLSEELKQMDHVVVTTLNPWLFKGRDELVHAYFDSLRDALGRSPSEKVRSVQAHLERYKASIEFVGTTTASIIDALMGSGAVTGVWKQWFIKLVGAVLKPKDLTAIHERTALETKLAEAKVAVVVLIDELDRVEDEEVRAVAQLVKAVGDIKGISYLVAYDPDRVAQALGRGNTFEDRRTTGESYLEKIIQFPIPLRPLFEDDARALLVSAMQKNGITIPTSVFPYQTEIYDQLIRVVRTPREIKRMIGAYSVLEEIVRGEICPYDVLAYSWLVTKAPNIRQRIADRIPMLVDDPGMTEMFRQQQWRRENNDITESVSEVLDTKNENQIAVLQLLFPRFGGSKNVSAKLDEGNRLAKRRNLIRLLYLGNPPRMMSRGDIEEVWSARSVEEAEGALRGLQQSEQLEELIDRIGDILPVLPPSGDLIFWGAVSRLLVRQHDWILREENTSSLVDDAGAILWRFAQTAPYAKARVKDVVEALSKQGDMLIVPWILRKHLFAHGLTLYRQQNHDQVIFEISETKVLRDAELPRYSLAVRDGSMLRRLPDTEAIYCLLNADQWDESLRMSFTSQIDSMQAITTLAALLKPPNVIVERKILDRMFDADAVLGVIEQLVKTEGLPENEFLASSLVRLRDALLGRDPHFGSPHNDNFGELHDMAAERFVNQ